MRVIGFDIGGANLKLASLDGTVGSAAFPLWKHPDQLAVKLRALGDCCDAKPDLIAVTMTGELADCYETKHDGVCSIIDQVQAAYPDSLIRIWMTSGEFATPDDARDLTTLVAAANWHALASWIGRIDPDRPALVLDVGSTTTDLIPVSQGLPANEGVTDLERLAAGELLYTGATRTPVCAVTRSVSLRQKIVPLAAELFATMKDVHILLGHLPADESDSETADGRPASRNCCLNRLAHMLCCDRTELTEDELVEVAAQIAADQLRQVTEALNRQFTQRAAGTTEPMLIISGSGSFLAHQAAQAVGLQSFHEVVELSTMFRSDISRAACAFAVARLAAERCLDDLLPLTVL